MTRLRSAKFEETGQRNSQRREGRATSTIFRYAVVCADHRSRVHERSFVLFDRQIEQDEERLDSVAQSGLSARREKFRVRILPVSEGVIPD
jgi:hypothetical protein